MDYDVLGSGIGLNQKNEDMMKDVVNLGTSVLRSVYGDFENKIRRKIIIEGISYDILMFGKEGGTLVKSEDYDKMLELLKPKTKDLTFNEAMGNLYEGKKIYRDGLCGKIKSISLVSIKDTYSDDNVYVELKPCFVGELTDGNEVIWYPRAEDCVATNWEIV